MTLSHFDISIREVFTEWGEYDTTMFEIRHCNELEGEKSFQLEDFKELLVLYRTLEHFIRQHASTYGATSGDEDEEDEDFDTLDDALENIMVVDKENRTAYINLEDPDDEQE